MPSQALETPGGDDDRQWLTYWLILAAVSVIERPARVLLSTVPRYYETKMALLLLLIFSPAWTEELYRRGRKRVHSIISALGMVKLEAQLFGSPKEDAEEELRCAELHGSPPLAPPLAPRHNCKLPTPNNYRALGSPCLPLSTSALNHELTTLCTKSASLSLRPRPSRRAGRYRPSWCSKRSPLPMSSKSASVTTLRAKRS